MINLFISGHSYQHDLYELIRVFLPEEEILFIESKGEYKGQGYLLESILYEDKTASKAISKITEKDETLYSDILGLGYFQQRSSPGFP